MRRNVGGCDRIMRILGGFALLLVGLLLLGGLRGEVWGLVVAAVGVLALATGVSGYCLLYALLGISTARGGPWMCHMMSHCRPGPGWIEGRPMCGGWKGGDPGPGGGTAARP